MHRRHLALALVAVFVVMLGAVALAPAPADAAVSVPVKGKQFDGVLTITGFVVDGTAVAAVGTLTGSTRGHLRHPEPHARASGPRFARARRSSGPVHLTIDAVSGPGNLLGNLLCAIAGLLDTSPLDLNALVALLNQLLALL